MKEKLRQYIKDNYEKERHFKCKLKDLLLDTFSMQDIDVEEDLISERKCSSVQTFIDEHNTQNRFQTLLFKMIDDRNLKDSDVYNKVHIDRRLFSKIRNDINYHPSKETIILLGISLELNENELEDLLDSASYSLPKNNNYDLIIRFCFINKIYDIDKINDFLSDYNCKLFSY